MKLKIVAFDWNGTLQNDFERIFEGVKAIFIHFGKPVPTLDEYRGEITNDYMRFYRNRGITASSVEVNAVMRNTLATLPHADLFPDARAVLEALKADGHILALISLQDEDILRGDLVHHGLSDFFDFVRAEAEWKDEVLAELFDLYSASPREIAYVSDTAHDMKFAKRAGVWAIAIDRGFHTQRKLLDARPDIFGHNLASVLREVQGGKE